MINSSITQRQVKSAKTNSDDPTNQDPEEVALEIEQDPILINQTNLDQDKLLKPKTNIYQFLCINYEPFTSRANFMQYLKQTATDYYNLKAIIKIIIVFILQIYGSSLYNYTVNTPHDLQWIHSQIGRLSRIMISASLILYLCILWLWMSEKKKLVLIIQLYYLQKVLRRNTGFFEEDHGGWCLSIFAFLWFIYILVTLIVSLFITLWKKGRKYRVCLITTVVIIMLFLVDLKLSITYATTNWKKGFQGIQIENDYDLDSCIIPLNHINYIDTINDYIYFWKIFIGEEEECRARSPKFKVEFSLDKKAINIQCESNVAYVITLPRVDKKNYKLSQVSFDWVSANKIIKLNQQLSENITVNMNNEHKGTLDLLQYDQEGFTVYCGSDSLFLERVVDFDSNFVAEVPELKLPKYNILVIYIDALSRKNFIRSFPKTSSLLDDKKFFKKNHIEIFQFLKMHSISPATMENTEAFLTGTISNNTQQMKKSDTQLVYKNLPAMEEEFSKYGWATVKIDNSCFDSMLYGFKSSKVWDKEFGFNRACDERDQGQGQSIFHGINSIRERCLDGEPIRKPYFRYLKQFLSKYRNYERPWFTWFSLTEAHEPTEQQISVVDEDLYDLLAYNVDYNNTIVQFYSDHGLHYGFWWAFQNEIFMLENRMPTNTMIFPSKLLDAKPEWRANLKENQQAFASHFDTRATWFDLIHESVGAKPYEPDEQQKLLSEKFAYFDEYDKEGPVRKAYNSGISFLRQIPRNRTIAEVGVPSGISICEKRQ